MINLQKFTTKNYSPLTTPKEKPGDPQSKRRCARFDHSMITILTRYILAMARPVGEFNQQKDRLFGIIKGLAGLGCCFATNKYLAKRMDVSNASVNRYLSALKAERKIDIRTGKALIGDDKSFYRKRSIRVLHAQPELKKPAPPKVEEIRLIEAEPAPVHGIADRELKEANDRLEAERAAMEAAYKEALAADGFDYNEVLREMQAELAAQGIEMEIWEHHTAKLSQ